MVFWLPTAAADSLVTEPGGDTYHFTADYQVSIAAPPSAVWKHAVDLPAWMFEFDMASVSGIPGTEGEVLNLYPNQDFKIQLLRQVPNELMVFTNLPSDFKGEQSTGIGIVTLTEQEGQTIVRLVMSRRYTWEGKGQNPRAIIRSSAAFQRQTREMWQHRFLGRLKSLAEK